LNFGVLLLCPAAKYFNVRIEERYGRLSQAFPGFDVAGHRRTIRELKQETWRVQSRITSLLEEVDMTLENTQAALLSDPYLSVQFGPRIVGLTADPQRELDWHFQTLVGDQQPPLPRRNRSDDEVWSVFHGPLAKSGIASHLGPHRVETPDFEIEFDHAVKNGAWHLFQPISLDLASPDSIREKVQRWVGAGVGIQSASNVGTLYFLVGKPKSEGLADAYRRGMSLLERIPGPDVQIIEEQNAERFANEIASQLHLDVGEEENVSGPLHLVHKS
jgi:hypothetical protein